ncbi:MAG: hypothetical protein CTY24_15260, partial [Methylobacter sp.]
MRFIFFIISALILNGCGLNVYKSTSSNTKGNSDFGKSYSLPEGRVSILVERKEKQKDIEVSITSKIVADQKNKLFLKYARNYLFEDTLVAETDAAGLLSTINTTTVDKTSAIFEQIGMLAGETFKLASLDANSQECVPKDMDLPFIKQYEINPDDTSSIINMNDTLMREHCITIDMSDIEDNNKPINSPSQFKEGVYYRDMKEFTVKINGNNTIKHIKINLPDRTSINKISVDRGLFVERKVNLTFTSGTLIK